MVQLCGSPSHILFFTLLHTFCHFLGVTILSVGLSASRSSRRSQAVLIPRQGRAPACHFPPLCLSLHTPFTLWCESPSSLTCNLKPSHLYLRHIAHGLAHFHPLLPFCVFFCTGD